MDDFLELYYGKPIAQISDEEILSYLDAQFKTVTVSRIARSLDGEVSEYYDRLCSGSN